MANSTGSLTESAGGPEIVHDIPVRQPTQNMSYGEGPVPAGGDPSSSSVVSDHLPIIPEHETSLPHLDQKDKKTSNSAPKDKKSSPYLATIVFAIAMVCLAAGAYLKFIANN